MQGLLSRPGVPGGGGGKRREFSCSVQAMIAFFASVACCLLAHGEEPDVRSQWLAAGLRRYAIGVSESGVRFDCCAAMVAGRTACDSGLTAGKARDAVMDSVRRFPESVRGRSWAQQNPFAPRRVGQSLFG